MGLLCYAVPQSQDHDLCINSALVVSLTAENNKKISREHRLATSGDIANDTMMNSFTLPDDKGCLLSNCAIFFLLLHDLSIA